MSAGPCIATIQEHITRHTNFSSKAELPVNFANLNKAAAVTAKDLTELDSDKVTGCSNMTEPFNLSLVE